MILENKLRINFNPRGHGNYYLLRDWDCLLLVQNSTPFHAFSLVSSSIPEGVCVACDHVIYEEVMTQRNELLVFQCSGARFRIMQT